MIACWLRRDLRLDDNTALCHALRAGQPVVLVFVFDRHILDPLPRRDARVEFIHRRLHALQAQVAALGSTLVVRHGHPEAVWPALAAELGLSAVYFNHDYEPYAQARDADIRGLLGAQGVEMRSFKDQVLWERAEVVSQAGRPYGVFTPYAKAWRAKWDAAPRPCDTGPLLGNLWQAPAQDLPALQSMGFAPTGAAFPAAEVPEALIRRYDQQRDFPAAEGVTRLGLHLRFGTLSIRRLAAQAQAWNATFLNELIWREFYMQVLANFPHVATGPFRPEYAAVPWRTQPDEAFARWCAGTTGYPLVDAGMRQLNATGYMHNRVRMVVASFLTKHLLIDYRLGEAYFAEKLLDFELASNNGGWQWAAGCGTDAAPYFRIFNPESQAQKFDAKGEYIRRWVPEYGTPAYPRPVVQHEWARNRALEAYKQALKREGGA